MKIVGECKKCGSCCVVNFWVHGKLIDMARKYYEAMLGHIDVCATPVGTLIRSTYGCRSLGIGNKCLVYDKRPEWCSAFPIETFTPQLFEMVRPEGCGFEVVDD